MSTAQRLARLAAQLAARQTAADDRPRFQVRYYELDDDGRHVYCDPTPEGELELEAKARALVNHGRAQLTTNQEL